MKTTGDYSLWSVGDHTVKVDGAVQASRDFEHTLAEIVCEHVRRALEAAPDLRVVSGLISVTLTIESARSIDESLR